MKTTHIKKETLLHHLRENREKHIADFEQAKAAFTEKRREAIKELYRTAHGDDLAQTKGVSEQIRELFSMPKPTSYAASYDRAIAQLELEERNVLEITADEFAQYVLDDWNWKGQYAASTATYKG